MIGPVTSPFIYTKSLAFHTDFSLLTAGEGKRLYFGVATYFCQSITGIGPPNIKKIPLNAKQ